MTYEEKIETLRAKIETQYRAEFQRKYRNLAGTDYETRETSVKATYGKKYVRLDVGTSGKYMVDPEGNIWGIKGYGVVHHGHWYGTLDTIDQYDWSGYRAVKIGSLRVVTIQQGELTMAKIAQGTA